MAQGILKASVGNRVDILSAGSKPSGYVHPIAITVMKEIGIDISDHTSKSLGVRKLLKNMDPSLR
jgi:arsenate reductase